MVTDFGTVLAATAFKAVSTAAISIDLVTGTATHTLAGSKPCELIQVGWLQ